LLCGGPARRPASLPGHGPGLLRGWSAGCLGGRRIAVRTFFSYPVLLVWAGSSALTLLVPRVRADDHDPAVPANDPALAADLLHARLDLHCLVSPRAARLAGYRSSLLL